MPFVRHLVVEYLSHSRSRIVVSNYTCIMRQSARWMRGNWVCVSFGDCVGLTVVASRSGGDLDDEILPFRHDRIRLGDVRSRHFAGYGRVGRERIARLDADIVAAHA